MLSSPYSNQVESLVSEVNNYFVSLFGLDQGYQREDITPGSKYGIISFRSLAPSSEHSTATKNVRTGFEFQELTAEILITSGTMGRVKAEATAIATMLDLQHCIPLIKRFLTTGGLIHDFRVEGAIETAMRQSLKPPHTWITDVTCTALAHICIYKNADGEHVLKQV